MGTSLDTAPPNTSSAPAPPPPHQPHQQPADQGNTSHPASVSLFVPNQRVWIQTIGDNGCLKWISPSLMALVFAYGLISDLHTSICTLSRHISELREFEVNTHRIKTMELLNLRQNGSVEEYKNRFEQLVYHILLYDTSLSETMLVSQFLLGLKEDLRYSIEMHLPTTVPQIATLAAV
jgi:hypothetical protein